MDYGAWRTEQNVDQALCAGRLVFQLRGKKLNGSWALIRKPYWAGMKREKWQLVKENDEEAKQLSEMDILIAQPLSIATGRTLAEIASGPPLFGPPKSRRNSNSQLSLFPDNLAS